MARPWTTKEIALIGEMSYKFPPKDIAAALGRTEGALKAKAYELGIPIQRYTRMVWCDHCAKWRTKINSNGQCPICIKRERLDVMREKVYQAKRAQGKTWD
jgi:hypothetical protein